MISTFGRVILEIKSNDRTLSQCNWVWMSFKYILNEHWCRITGFIVERWHPKAHTFHFLGWNNCNHEGCPNSLGSSGRQSTCDRWIQVESRVNLLDLCPRLLGVVSCREDKKITKTGVQLSWLKEGFWEDKIDTYCLLATEE